MTVVYLVTCILRVMSTHLSTRTLSVITFVLLVIAGLVWGGVYFYLHFGTAPAEGTPSEDVASEQVSPAQRAAELIAAGDVDACAEIADHEYRVSCVNNIVLNQAKDAQDSTLCQGVDGVQMSVSFCEQQVRGPAAADSGADERFMQLLSGVDVVCEAFSSTAAQTDCELFQQLATEGITPQTLAGACASAASELFQQQCALLAPGVSSE